MTCTEAHFRAVGWLHSKTARDCAPAVVRRTAAAPAAGELRRAAVQGARQDEGRPAGRERRRAGSHLQQKTVSSFRRRAQHVGLIPCGTGTRVSWCQRLCAGLPAAAVRCCARAGLRGWRMLRSTGVSGRGRHLGMPPMLQSLGSRAAAAAARNSWAADTAAADTAAAAGTGRGSEGNSAAGSCSAGVNPAAESRAAPCPDSWAATGGRWGSTLAAVVAAADSPGRQAGHWLHQWCWAAGRADLRRQRKGQRQAAGWTDLEQGHLAPEAQKHRQGRRLRTQSITFLISLHCWMSDRSDIIGIVRQPQNQHTPEHQAQCHLEVHQRLRRPQSLLTGKDRRLGCHMRQYSDGPAMPFYCCDEHAQSKPHLCLQDPSKTCAAWKLGGNKRSANALHTSLNTTGTPLLRRCQMSACLYASQVCRTVYTAIFFANAVCKSQLGSKLPSRCAHSCRSMLSSPPCRICNLRPRSLEGNCQPSASGSYNSRDASTAGFCDDTASSLVSVV